MKPHVVETHIVFVAAVERIVCRSPCLFPFVQIFRVVVLVVVADDGEYPHLRRTEHFSYLLFEHRVETAVVLHVVAHAEPIDRCFLWQRTYRASYVCHRFSGKPLHIADFQRLVVGTVVVGVKVVGHLWVAQYNHLVVFLHTSLQLLQRETVSCHAFDYGLVEMCGVVFGRVYGHLAVCRHGEEYEACRGVVGQFVASQRVGGGAVYAVAHHYASHRIAFRVGHGAVDERWGGGLLLLLSLLLFRFLFRCLPFPYRYAAHGGGLLWKLLFYSPAQGIDYCRCAAYSSEYGDYHIFVLHLQYAPSLFFFLLVVAIQSCKFMKNIGF